MWEDKHSFIEIWGTSDPFPKMQAWEGENVDRVCVCEC